MKEKTPHAAKKGRRVSVRTLFCIFFLLLMLGTVSLSFLFSSLFLERYYVRDRKEALARDYSLLQTASIHDLMETDAFDLTLRKALRRDNVSLLVMDSETRTLKAWSADIALMEVRLRANLFGLTPVISQEDRNQAQDALKKEEGSAAPAGKDGTDPAQETAGAQEQEGAADADGDGGQEDAAGMPGKGKDLFSEYVITQILEEGQPYTVCIVKDLRAGTRSMEMWGPLGVGSFFLLRSPLEDIRQSAAAANRFYSFSGLLFAVIGAFAAWHLSGWITRPVRQLTDISVRMRQLDFGAKYEGGSHTELDTLGVNMNALSETLESTISALRTANNDLQRDLDRRDRQEEMRQEFLSNVTHELKTPIALIHGYAEGLQDGIADDPESRSFYLETIIEESDRMNTIVQKVLMLNHLEFGDGSVTMERFDIVDMIRNYLESAALLAQQEGAELILSLEGPLYVWGDPFLIQEVFQNYYSNALHHVKAVGAADAPEKVIDIRCDASGDAVRVTVFNTGNPIPEEALPHIWEKFYKVDKARTRAYGGSGVGLSIVKAIMDLHHRGYGAENYENGVAFWFELDGMRGQE